MIVKIFTGLVVICFVILIALGYNSRTNAKNHNKLLEIQNFLIDNYKEEKNTQKKPKINMPIYYINLDRSINRKIHMESQKDMYNLDMTRVSAIDGKKLNKNMDILNFNGRAFKYYNNFNKSSLSELGCLFSHYKAIYTAFENGDLYALILEDDISFSLLPYWPVDLEQIINEAPHDWNIISLYKQVCFNNKEPYIKYSQNKENDCYSTLAYIINRKGMENCLKTIYEDNMLVFDKNKQKWPEHLASDTYIYYIAGNTYWYNKHALFFSYNDGENMNSTIHTDHTADHINRALRTVSSYLVEKHGQLQLRQCWSTNRPIPKILHQIWHDWKGQGIPKKYTKWSDECKNLHSDWEYKLWDTENSRQFLEKYYSWFLPVYDRYDKPIKRVDALRYFLLFHYGGVYMDMDFICLKNINSLLKDGHAIFGYQFQNINKEGSVCNAFMGSPPQHPLFENIIYALENNSTKDVLKATGPIFLTNEIKKYFGVDITIYKMPIIYTHEWNTKTSKKCVENTEYCRDLYPSSYTTTVWGAGWH